MMMMRKNRRRSATRVEEDRISNLPDHVIDSILEHLPFEDAVRTSIISKSWRYRWTTRKKLVLDLKFWETFAKNGAFGLNGFIKIINQFFILHKGPISTFHVIIPEMYLDSFQEVNQWILLLSRKSVRELVFLNLNRRYKLHLHVFSCLGLTKLQLENCFFKPPTGFEGFPNLEELFLDKIDFGDNLCGTQINLPRLKKLILIKCTNVYNFNIKASKLESWYVFPCPDAMFLRLLDNSCLREVGISLQTVEDFAGVERMNLVSMLSHFPKIECFSINGNFLKFLFAEYVPKWFPSKVNSLKRLSLLQFHVGEVDQLRVALCLLRNSPNLDTFYIHMEEPRVDVEPLEAQNCLDCTLNQLLDVMIEDLEGSRLQLLFIKLLLAHSPSLEKLTIIPSKYLDVQKRFDITKNVMRFPRASTKAELIYLSPES